jgi:5-methylcytosine-specific restriction endonuclease McrA
MTDTLLLNASYEPLKIVHWQKAVTLLYRGKVEVLEEHEVEVRAVTFTFRLPSVVRLLRYVKVRTGRVAFTRSAVYSRDDRTCQYCGGQFEVEDLTYDHVLPIAQGGAKSFENIVTACVPCNRRKDNRTPEQAGMPLQRAPVRPLAAIVLRVGVGVRRTTPMHWRPYLFAGMEG